jgi:hypothetical protein
MSNNDFLKEKIISNFISLNPTGTLTLSDSGTFKMNGIPSKIMTPAESAKQNLNNVNSNKFICNQNDQKIEKFENYNIQKNNIEKKSNKNIIIYLFIFLFLLLIILFIYKKRIFK